MRILTEVLFIKIWLESYVIRLNSERLMDFVPGERFYKGQKNVVMCCALADLVFHNTIQNCLSPTPGKQS